MVVAVDDMRIAVSQGDGKVGVHVNAEVSLDEVFIPSVVGIKEADERRLQSGEAALDRAGLADIGVEADIVEP